MGYEAKRMIKWRISPADADTVAALMTAFVAGTELGDLEIAVTASDGRSVHVALPAERAIALTDLLRRLLRCQEAFCLAVQPAPHVVSESGANLVRIGKPQERALLVAHRPLSAGRSSDDMKACLALAAAGGTARVRVPSVAALAEANIPPDLFAALCDLWTLFEQGPNMLYIIGHQRDPVTHHQVRRLLGARKFKALPKRSDPLAEFPIAFARPIGDLLELMTAQGVPVGGVLPSPETLARVTGPSAG